jgi:hypothetical protein
MKTVFVSVGPTHFHAGYQSLTHVKKWLRTLLQFFVCSEVYFEVLQVYRIVRAVAFDFNSNILSELPWLSLACLLLNAFRQSLTYVKESTRITFSFNGQ